jgi:uncharacterized membrane protein
MATSHSNILSTQSGNKGAFKRSLEWTIHQFGEFLLAQWATIITWALGLLVFAAFSIPFLSYFGLDIIAKPLFYALHYVCAQIPSHSFYVFGHQFGLCERNLSIYTSMFLGSLLFVLTKKRLFGIPWWLWLLMILPMALDGTTQMLGLRESTWILRVVTGTLFGLGSIWFALPLMERAMQEPVVPLQSLPKRSQLSQTVKSTRNTL